MASYLLSIFPLKEEDFFARVSLIALDETALLRSKPFTIDRPGLLSLLRQTSLAQFCQSKLAEVGEGTVLQVPITEDDAAVIILHSGKWSDAHF